MGTSLLSPNTRNYAMPRGRISFAKFNSSGATTGEVDIGNCVAFDLTPKYTYKDHLTSRGPFNVLDASFIAQMEYDLKFTPEERSRENMALFFLDDPDNQKSGGTGNYAQSAVHTTNQSFVPYFDRWVDVGKRLLKTGTVSLTRGSDTKLLSTLVAGTDYRVDYENGLLMILSSTALVSDWPGFVDGDSSTKVNFSCGDATLPKFVQGVEPIIGFLRYMGYSDVGPRHSIKLWKVQINPDSAIKMLDPANYAGLSFTGKVYIDDDTGAHSTTPFGEFLELEPATSYPS